MNIRALLLGGLCVLFVCGTLVGCSLKPLESVQARLRFSLAAPVQSQIFSSLSSLAPMTVHPAIEEFRCFMVNVVGEGISTEPDDLDQVAHGLETGFAGGQCTYFGKTSPLLDVLQGPVSAELSVPKGPVRLIQLFGLVFDGASCPGGVVLRKSADYEALGVGEGYELSRAVVAVDGDTSIELANLYDAENPKMLSDCGHATEPSLPGEPALPSSEVYLPIASIYRIADSASTALAIPVSDVLPASDVGEPALSDLADPVGAGSYIFSSADVSGEHGGLILNFPIPDALALGSFPGGMGVDLGFNVGSVGRSAGACIAQDPSSPVLGDYFTILRRVGNGWVIASTGIGVSDTHISFGVDPGPLDPNFFLPAVGSIFHERMFTILLRNEAYSTSGACSGVAVRFARTRLLP